MSDETRQLLEELVTRLAADYPQDDLVVRASAHLNN